MTRGAGRFLAAVLGIYLALSLGRTAGELMIETRRAESMKTGLARVTARISALENVRAMTDEDVRQWARSRGLVAPEDIVFFDGGREHAGDAELSQK